MTDPDFDLRAASYLDGVRRKIRDYGFAVQGVFPSEDDPKGEGFCYTVGLSGKQHPELLIRSLGASVSAEILNGLGQRLLAGEVLPVGVPIPGVLDDGYDVILVYAATRDLGVARTLFPGVTALQVVWPDSEHRFPWNIGYNGPPQPAVPVN